MSAPKVNSPIVGFAFDAAFIIEVRDGCLLAAEVIPPHVAGSHKDLSKMAKEHGIPLIDLLLLQAELFEMWGDMGISPEQMREYRKKINEKS